MIRRITIDLPGRRCRALAVVWAAIALSLTGCSGDLAAVLAALEVTDRPKPDVVTVQFRNLTAETAVDVQFYVSNTAVEDLPEGLFVEKNLIREQIGDAGSGILGPFDTDTIELPCSPGLIIGSKGGRFLDNGTGDLVGNANARWVSEPQLGLCGFLVRFDYRRQDDSFDTGLRVSG